ncbi:MAG TPA: NB-ARC domain-containing protein [Pseudonocardiaceae bacterium]|nr:NB-ARC domain-containing protein [Pseudonocardiaceae bacterium]
MADEGRIHQEVSGTVTGNVVQANTIGQVVVNAPTPRSFALAEEVPEPPRHYTNFAPELTAITTAVRPAAGEFGPHVQVVTGQPASGKTGLVCKWAEEHGEHYPGGVFFARLTEEPDTYQVLACWLSSYFDYAYRELPPGLAGIRKLWRSKTRDRRVLLVLDDAGSYEDVETLLPGRGESAVLVVSIDEVTRFSAGLAARPIRLTPLHDDQALALLGKRIGRERVETEQDAAIELVKICGRLPGPLNIVGAVLDLDPHLTIAAQVQRLTEQGVLTHLGLNVIYDAAYDRLTPDEQRAYHALGAHPGAQLVISADAIAAAIDLDVPATERALDKLYTVSLAGKRGAGRYQLNSLVAEHAAARAGTDLATLRARAIAYYRDLGLRCAEKLMPNRGWWPDIVPLADANIAQAWLVSNGAAILASAEEAARCGDQLSVVQLCLVSWPLDTIGSNPARTVRLNQLGVAAAAALDNDLLSSVMYTQLGFGYRDQGDRPHATEAFEAAMRLGTNASMASAMEGLALMLRNHGDTARARTLLIRNLELADHILAENPTDGSAQRRHRMARFHLATVLPPEAAVPELREVLAAFAGEIRNQAKINLWLGRKLIESGDGAGAIDPLRAAAELAASSGLTRERGLAYEALADADTANAQAHLREASSILRLEFPDDEARVRARMTEPGS